MTANKTKSATIINYLKIVVIVMAVFNLGKWAYNTISKGYHPLDFNTYFAAAEAIRNGKNPYDSTQRKLGTQALRIENPGVFDKYSPHETPVYAPGFYTYFTMYLKLGYVKSKYLNLFLNLIILAGIAWLLCLLSKDLKFAWTLAGLAAFRGTWFALENGQPMLICLLSILASIYLADKLRWPILAGILLGFFSFKFTLLIPPALYFLLSKRYKLFVGLSASIIATNWHALANLNSVSISEPVNAWHSNIEYIWSYGHVFADTNGLNIINCSTSSLMGFAGVPHDIIKLTYILALTSGLALCAFINFKSKPGRENMLLLLYLTTFSFSQHLMYDLLALTAFGMLAFERSASKISNPVLLTMIALMILPVGRIFETLGMPYLNFVLPICILVLTISVFGNYLSRIYNAAKKPN